MKNFGDREPYFRWLLAGLDIVPGRSDHLFEDYGVVLRQLFDTPFKVVIEKDINRLYDAILLRDEYYTETGEDLFENPDGCSLLEILIGLSKRISEEIVGDEDNQNLKKHWFWTWLYNLGLMDFRYAKSYEKGVTARLSVWLNRDFEPDGYGSPFPLNEPPDDQRGDEMWKQAMLYLSENLGMD